MAPPSQGSEPPTKPGRFRRRRQRRPGQQDDILELLALSAGWVLIVLGVLHVAGLAYLPLGTR